MEHVKYDLGVPDAGTRVFVSLDQQANVWLLDAANYSRYTAGKDGRAYGGRQVRSPATLSVPTHGHWYVAIDLGGNSGNIRSSVVTS